MTWEGIPHNSAQGPQGVKHFSISYVKAFLNRPLLNPKSPVKPFEVYSALKALKPFEVYSAIKALKPFEVYSATKALNPKP